MHSSTFLWKKDITHTWGKSPQFPAKCINNIHISQTDLSKLLEICEPPSEFTWQTWVSFIPSRDADCRIITELSFYPANLYITLVSPSLLCIKLLAFSLSCLQQFLRNTQDSQRNPSNIQNLQFDMEFITDQTSRTTMIQLVEWLFSSSTEHHHWLKWLISLQRPIVYLVSSSTSYSLVLHNNKESCAAHPQSQTCSHKSAEIKTKKHIINSHFKLD